MAAFLNCRSPIAPLRLDLPADPMAPVPPQAMREVLVLGGGISGLSAAFFLRQALQQLPGSVASAIDTPTRVRVLDASPSTGGWVRTARQDGFLFEEGPRGFRPSRNGAEMLRLVEQLGLQQDMAAVDPAAHARYILRNGKVEKIPSTVVEALRWPLAGQVLKAGIHEFFAAKGSGEDESIYDFTARRFSPVVAERLLDPMASGIFGGDIRYLSMRACFRMLVDLEQRHGSVVRGMLLGGGPKSDTLLDGSLKSDFVREHEKSVSISFRDGMSTLMDAMAKHIKNDPLSELRTSTKATKIELQSQADAPPSFVVTTENAATGKTEQVTASHVISTIPACYLAPAVRDALPSLAAALDEIKFVDMAMVHVGFHERAHSTDGFGYLVPTSERERMLGVVFDSNTFPVQNSAAGSPESEDQTRLTVMAGGAHFPDILAKSESEIRGIALDALRRHIGIKKTPDLARVLTMQNAIPQYHVGFESTLRRVEKAARQAPGLLLGGNSLYGIGLADCVTRSKQLAMDFAASITANGRAAR